MTTMSVSGWAFLLVPVHPGCPGQIPQSRKTVVCVYHNFVRYFAVLHTGTAVLHISTRWFLLVFRQSRHTAVSCCLQFMILGVKRQRLRTTQSQVTWGEFRVINTHTSTDTNRQTKRNTRTVGSASPWPIINYSDVRIVKYLFHVDTLNFSPCEMQA